MGFPRLKTCRGLPILQPETVSRFVGWVERSETHQSCLSIGNKTRTTTTRLYFMLVVMSKIGSRTAITMNPTIPPMKRITTGSSREVSEVIVVSTSSS